MMPILHESISLEYLKFSLTGYCGHFMLGNYNLINYERRYMHYECVCRLFCTESKKRVWMCWSYWKFIDQFKFWLNVNSLERKHDKKEFHVIADDYYKNNGCVKFINLYDPFWEINQIKWFSYDERF